MAFTLEATDAHSAARAGTLTTDHGDIRTPIFMPVGTVGTVKAVHQHELKNDIKAQIILGNTYHLYLRPGTDVIEAAGGLHKFIGWDKPMLTDSGGYQVYSLSSIRKIKEEGVTFQSHIDGSRHTFTPEKVVEIQRSLGSDITMAFDECPPYPSTYQYAQTSLALTGRWLARGWDHFHKLAPLYGHFQYFFPIVQGGVYDDLREESVAQVSAYPAQGFAIGGLAVGEPIEEMYRLTQFCATRLPKEKPRYLMGVGTPENLLQCIARGVDMFDCVMPTRNGRNGMIYTTRGIMNIKNTKWKTVFEPLNPTPLSFVDSDYTCAYVRHLLHSEERLGAQIASIANLAFYLWLMGEARAHILEGDYAKWMEAILPVIMKRL